VPQRGILFSILAFVVELKSCWCGNVRRGIEVQDEGIYRDKGNASASLSNSNFMNVKEEPPVKHDLHI
jgi:hypothetical protein